MRESISCKIFRSSMGDCTSTPKDQRTSMSG